MATNISTVILGVVLCAGLSLGCLRPVTPPAPPSPATPPPPTSSPSTLCNCGVKVHRTRIVGGQVTEENEYPWQVALTKGGSSSPFCGGTLLTSRHVITAAHCTSGQSASSITAVVGEHDVRDSNDGQERISIASKTEHPNWNSGTGINYDFSILTLSRDVTFRTDVKPICLPKPSRSYEGITATVTGWGTLSFGGSQPAKLNEVDVQTMSNVACSGQNTAYGPQEITSQMICAASPGKDACQGDSGGPLIAPENGGRYNSLIGVVSWGSGCAQSDAPGVYARITDQLQWIQTTIAGAPTCSPPA